MAKLIALDDGHGLTDANGKPTPGKRTPPFEDGSVMYENEFNSRVVALLDQHLRRSGFRTLLVAPTDFDTPLKERTDRANENKADFYLSVHANAMTGTWEGGGEGIETFYYPDATQSKKAAAIIHKHLLNGTDMKNRGVKTANFHVLRETSCPAVLVECGFMDNRREAELLRSEPYRRECAEEIARGICEYFGVAYVEELTATPPVSSTISQWKLDIHQEARDSGIITSDWSSKLDEPAPVWMVLAAINNSLKAAKENKENK